MDNAKLEIALANVYSKKPSAGIGYSYAIAELCDSYLDRSGALLGRVRALALKLDKENQIENLKHEIEQLQKELGKLEA